MPVPATRAGGATEVVAADETALVVEPGDADVLARAIAWLLQDRSTAARLAEQARPCACAFQSSPHGSRVARAVYRAALESFQPRGTRHR